MKQLVVISFYAIGFQINGINPTNKQLREGVSER